MFRLLWCARYTLTHVDPKLAQEEVGGEKVMDLNNPYVYNHLRYACVYSDHKHLNQQLYLYIVDLYKN